MSIRLILIGSMFLTGCQIAPVRYDQQGEGQWQAKALIRDSRVGKSAIVNLDINAVQAEKLRMDVTAAMGHPIASLVMNGDKLTYVLIESKEYYKGAPTEAALRPVLSASLDPKLLYNVLFDIPIENKNWNCSKDKSGYLSECRRTDGDIKIRWSERKGRRKLVNVEHPQGQLQINISAFRPKVEDGTHLFELNPPKSFRQIQ